MSARPINNFEGLYEVTERGEVISNVTSNTKFLTPSPVQGFNCVTLRKSGQSFRVYVARTVFEAFGELPADYYDRPNKYVITHKNNISTDDHIDNLEIMEKAEKSRSVFKGSRRVNVSSIEKLPENYRLIEQRIYHINELDDLYLEMDGIYHHVISMTKDGVAGLYAGGLFIRIAPEDLPERFKHYNKRDRHYSLSVAAIMLTDYMGIPRPTDSHTVGYLDFNSLNLTRTNLIWETSVERNKRLAAAVPGLTLRYSLNGKGRLKGVKSDRVKSSIEKMFFIKNKTIAEILKAHQMDPKEYRTRVRYYLYKIKDGITEPVDPEVKQHLNIESSSD